MPDTKLEDLPPGSALSGADKIYVVQGGNSREISLAELAAWVKTEQSIVPANLPHRGARVYRTANTGAGTTFPYVVPWQAEEFDTDGFWSLANPTQLVVPAGVSKVRLIASVGFEDNLNALGLSLVIRKNDGAAANNSFVAGLPYVTARESSAGYASNIMLASSGVMSVVPGDYFDVRVNCSVMNIDEVLSSKSWFEIEVVETA